jgi:plastocyanin
MNNKILVGAVVAIVAVGGITAAVVLNKKDTPKTASTTDTSQMDMNNDTATNQEDTKTTPTDANAPLATNEVAIENFTYGPLAITVKKGTAVTWTNKDSAAHTVTADKGQGPASGTLQQGDKYTFTYNTAGTFTYHCNFHGNMTGTVVVTE